MAEIPDHSTTLEQYKTQMKKVIHMIYPIMDPLDVDQVLKYSIDKRYMREPAAVSNSYTKRTANMDLLAIADYIADRQPILTAYGAMFKQHGTVPNPMLEVVQSFLDMRTEHKKIMFTFPRGSEDFEKYNLLQSLSLGCIWCESYVDPF